MGSSTHLRFAEFSRPGELYSVHQENFSRIGSFKAEIVKAVEYRNRLQNRF